MGGRGGRKGRKSLAGWGPAAVLGVAAAVLVTLGGMALASFAVARLGWAWAAGEWMVLLIGGVSCLIGGTVCGRLAPSRKLPMAVGCALVWLGLWLLLGWLICGGVEAELLGRSLAAALVGGILAGVFASNRKNSGK